MDAAIAGAVLLGICEPQMTGLGGDCFVLWSDASGKINALNGSGRAPAALDAADLRNSGETIVPLQSPHSVTIPGAVDAFCALSDRVGKLGIDRVLAPAIHYAEHGVPVAQRVAYDWARDAQVLQGGARAHYLVNGRLPTAGQMFAAPGQAQVMRKIAAEGRNGFYDGEVAADMLATLNAMGGKHTTEDFASALCTDTAPVSSMYKGTELFEHPPNGHGATANLMLNMLAHFDIAGMDPFGTERTHIETEVAKLAYDARNRFLGDMDYTTRLEHMLALDTAVQLAALIDPKRAMADVKRLSEQVHKDTIYITVVDRDGMAVSLIYSIFHGFGSGIASDKYGILFQNRGAGFNLEAGHPNELKGGKRPMHTIIPGMLAKAGKPIMPFGVMGGAYQPHGHARFVSNMIDFGMDPQTSIDAPRCFSDQGQMRVERGYSDNVRAELTEMGHNVIVPETPIGGAQAIMIHSDGVLEGASDARKDGCALGY